MGGEAGFRFFIAWRVRVEGWSESLLLLLFAALPRDILAFGGWSELFGSGVRFSLFRTFFFAGRGGG